MGSKRVFKSNSSEIGGINVKKAYTTFSVFMLAALIIWFLNNSEEGMYAFIPNADDGSISIINTDTDELIKNIKVQSKLSDGIASSRDGKWIYAGNYSKGELLIINVKTGKIKKKVQTGKNLHGIDMTPDGKYLYLASGDLKEGEEYNYISIFDTGKNKIINSIRTNSKSPSHIDFSHDGSLAYAANIMSNEISLIDTKKMEIIATIPVGTIPNEVEASKDDKFLYVANVADGTISIIDILKQEEIKTIKAGEGTHGLALSPNGKFLYAANRNTNDLVKLDLKDNRILEKVVTGKTANHVSFVPNSKKLYVTNKDSNDLAIVNADTLEVIKKVPLGKTPHEISFSVAVK
ncbi:MAG: cytochrome D1 domain-containing protein [Thermotaleaceae bacterium]